MHRLLLIRHQFTTSEPWTQENPCRVCRDWNSENTYSVVDLAVKLEIGGINFLIRFPSLSFYLVVGVVFCYINFISSVKPILGRASL